MTVVCLLKFARWYHNQCVCVCYLFFCLFEGGAYLQLTIEGGKKSLSVYFLSACAKILQKLIDWKRLFIIPLFRHLKISLYSNVVFTQPLRYPFLHHSFGEKKFPMLF